MILHFIRDHERRYRAFNEQELHDAIMEDEMRGYYDTSSPVDMKPMLSWCAPVTEIAEAICKFGDKTLRDDVCRTVLNRCSFFHEQGYIFKEDTEAAMWKFFAELTPDANKNYEAKENYISQYIDYVIIRNQISPSSHSGDTWRRFCQNFHKEMQNSWKGLYRAEDFLEWARAVEEDFGARYEKAKKEGLFKEGNDKFVIYAVGQSAN